ncbi:MAG: hypothetical protein HYV36_01885 [Lentisphaerae bacterium]|nr:hypothetical protein [Lentisphaerota bacterium]
MTRNGWGWKACPALSRVFRAALIAAAIAVGFSVFPSAAEVIVETTTWSKYDNTVPSASDVVSTNGRIPLGNAGRGDDYYAIAPTVIKDGATYKMWYTGYDSPNFRIYYATSPDGLTWTKSNNVAAANSDTTSTDGRIPLGSNTKGDDSHAAYNTVILDGNTYKMWYSGHDGTYYRIYYATSSNGLTWTKYSNAIPANSDTSSSNGCIPMGTADTGDDNGALMPMVIKDGNTYKMWYSGDDGTNRRTYYATSPDGLTWTKYNNAVPTNSNTTTTDGRLALGTDGKGDDNYISFPAVIKVGATYKMWYSGYDQTNERIYHATSPDGLTWTKHNNVVPTNSNTTSIDGRIPRGTAGKGDDRHTGYCAVIREGNTYKMWYYGQNLSDTYIRIYHATCTPPAGTIILGW